MLRAFSFDNGDDGHRDNSSSYRPLPRGPPSSPLPPPPPPPPPHSYSHSPRPPIHGALPLPQERQPLRNNDDDDYYYYDHHHHQSHSHPYTRHASSSSLSSSTSSASFVARGGLGAPSPRSFQQQQQQQQQYYQRDMYSNPQQQQHALPVLPDAGGGGSEDARYDADPRPYIPATYPATDTTLHSAPPMSQATHVPLAGTPGSRFADPVPSPPTPAFHFGADTFSAAPPPPLHRGADSPTNRVLNDPVGGHYTDNPYTRYSTTWDPQLVARQLQAADPEGLIFSDDEDDTIKGRHAGGVVTTGAAAGGAAVVGRSANTTPAGGLLGSSSEGGGSTMLLNEKARPSDWMQKQAHSKKKTRWIVALILVLVLLAAAGGATAGVLLSRRNSGTSSAASKDNPGSSITSGGGGGLTGVQDVAKNGDLNKDSPEIKALMSNGRLHRVFHGMDYTPLNSQFPDCLQNPPSQNNVTRDIAVMSLLTNKIRLYGNDCNQTEMVMHAISALAVPMTVWLGVWLDSNTTTNTRQLTHLYTLLSSYPSTAFEGVAVGNEVLFRENLSEQSLFSTIAAVRTNMTALSITLPVATSDLGSNWKANMLPYVDVLMANVHPFFAGVVVEKAADWTWAFFRDNDVVLTTTLPEKSRPRVMISEVGWPSAGGAQGGSVAGVDQMNRFLVDFVCAQNKLGTEYYWFSAFDEPWKVVYNTLGKEWEDKWGLMDVNRDLKDGLVIPTCT